MWRTIFTIRNVLVLALCFVAPDAFAPPDPKPTAGRSTRVEEPTGGVVVFGSDDRAPSPASRQGAARQEVSGQSGPGGKPAAEQPSDEPPAVNLNDPDSATEVIQRQPPAQERVREERFRAQIERTIQQLQAKQQSAAEEVEDREARHRTVGDGERENFEPEVETVDAKRKAQKEKEGELIKAVDRSLKKLEQQKLTPAQEAQLEFALNTFEKGPKTEGDYFQVVAQIMAVADKSVVAREIATIPDAPSVSQAEEVSGSGVIVSSDKPEELPNAETQKVASVGLREISKILKPQDVAVVKPEFGKSSLGVGVKQSGNYKSPLSNMKVDIPGKTSPLSFQDKAKAWIKRVVKLLTGKENPGRETASKPELVVNADFESPPPSELLAPMESSQGVSEVSAPKPLGYGLRSWAIALGVLLFGYYFLRKTRLFH